MNSLKENIIRKFNAIDSNTYNNSNMNNTVEILNFYSQRHQIDIKRNRNKKLTNLYYKNKKVGFLKGLKVNTTEKVAFDLCRDKFMLEKYLQKFNINTLKSKVFNENEYEEALSYIETIQNTSFVLKPLSLAGGKGIELNIKKEDFKKAWDESLKIQKHEKVKDPSCLIQPYIDGFDVRISIIEGVFSAATLRLPAHIVGNNHNTIKELIEQKNNERKSIQYFKNKLIPINQSLEKKLAKDKLSLESVLGTGDVYLLSDISNLTLGGESIDVTNQVSEELINLAIESIAAIPGMYTGGVDIMTEDFEKGDGYIIEINTNANHTMHHLPLKGKPSLPFDDLIRNLLIKHKVSMGIGLSKSESLKFKNINNFNLLKNKYSCQYYANSDDKS